MLTFLSKRTIVALLVFALCARALVILRNYYDTGQHLTTEPMTFYVVRHGSRHDWVDERWFEESDRPLDPPLSKHGVQQAAELASYLKRNNIRIKHLFCSPYLRTIMTANEVAKAWSLKIKLERGLSEYYSEYKRSLYNVSELEPLPLDALVQLFPDTIDTSYQSLYSDPMNFETLPMLQARVRTTLERILGYVAAAAADAANNNSNNSNGNNERNNGANINDSSSKSHGDGDGIMIVSHAATVIVAVRELAAANRTKAMEQYWQRYPVRAGVASCSKLVRKRDSNDALVWELEWNGSTKHLSGGEEAHWNFPQDDHLYQPLQ